MQSYEPCFDTASLCGCRGGSLRGWLYTGGIHPDLVDCSDLKRGNPAGGADGDADMAGEEGVGDYLSGRFFIDGIIISQQT